MRKTVLGKYPALTKNECQNKHKGIAPLRVLCLCVFRKQHPVVDIVITGNLPAVVSIEFDDFRKIVINCIKFKILFPVPFDSFWQGFPRTASPENEFIAITFPFLEIFNTSERKVYIPGFVAQCLIDIKKEQDEVKEALGSEYTDYNLIMAKTMKV